MNNNEAYQVLEDGVVGSKRHEALKLAKKALIKQIPVTPYNDSYCPICDFYVGDINDDHYLYCPMCGQRIFDALNIKKEENEESQNLK